MQALYDSHARAVALKLQSDSRQDETREIAPGAIVGLRDGRPVEVELLAVGSDDDAARLRRIADAYGLDAEALAAGLHAAVAAPNRRVTVSVAASPAV